MRFEYSKTGVWAAITGAVFWVLGLLIFFIRFDDVVGLKYVNDWVGYFGTTLWISGLFLIIVAGQIIRSTLKGETIQPRKDDRVRLLVCPNCSAENPDDARFCLDCGKKLKAGSK